VAEEKPWLDKAALVSRNASFLIMARVSSALLLMILWAWIARELGPAAFDDYAFAVVAVANVYAFLTDFGARHYTTREVALDRAKMGSLLINGSVAKAVVTAATLVPMLLFVYFAYMPQGGRHLLLVSAVACMSMILKQYVIFLMAFYDGCEKMHVTAAVNIGQTLLITAFVSAALLMGAATVVTLLLAELAAMVLISVTVLWLTLRLSRAFKGVFEWAKVREFGRLMTPFGLYFLFGILYFRSDGFMLKKMVGEDATALYLVVVNPLVHLELVARLASVALYPTLSKEVSQNIERGRAMFGQAMRVLFTMGLPMVLGCTLFANKLAVAAFGVEYADSGPLLMVVAWAMLMRFPAYASNTLLFATNKQAFGAMVAAVFFVLNVGVNLVLIPRYGAMGAAITSVITSSGVEIVRYIYARRIVGAPGLPRLWAPAVCSGVVMVCVGFVLKAYDMPLIPIIAVEAVVYFGCLLALKGITKEDLATIKRMVRRGERTAVA